MDYFLLGILFLSLVLGFLAVLFNAFGTWIIFFGALFYAYATHFTVLSVKMMMILGGIALAGELIENVLSYFGIKKMGGGTRSVWGAFFGGIAGGLIGAAFLGVGVIAGGLLGVFLGAYLMDLTRSGGLLKSLKVGFGGLLGVAGAVFIKLIAALVMIQLILVRVWKG